MIKFVTKLFFLNILLMLALSGVRAQDAQKPPTSTDELSAFISAQIPPPPQGFLWQQFKNSFFPKPTGWNEQILEGTLFAITRTVYAISPEKFSATKQFEMGMTLEILSGSKKTMNTEAKNLALAMLKPIFDSHKKEEILIFDQNKRGDFDIIFLRYRDAPAGLTPIIIHKFIAANNVADSVHTFTFESPVETWDSNWAKYGTPIISKINIIPTMSAN